MQGYGAAFPWPLLLLLQSAWAVLRVSVPSSPIRASPLTNQRLPCNFSDPSRPIALGDLAVTWKRGAKTIAEYLGGFRPMRKGAEMSEERLQVGDASLLLPQLEDADAGVYTCLVIFTPEKQEGSFELKLEAEPHVAVRSTKLQLAREGTVTCKVSGFYPGNVSVEWLKDGAVLKGPQTSVHQDSENRLYHASSVLELTPSIADANANFSCQVRHQSLKGPLKENFQLLLQALPSLQVFTGVSQKALEVLECLVSGFYPQDVQVHWLRNEVRQQQVESEPQKLHNGTFYLRSMIRPREMDPNVSYVCHVQHKAWDNPLEMEAHWQLKDEGEGVICPTPQHPQDSRTEGTPRSCSPTPVPTSPTSATGAAAVWPWAVFGLGLVLCIIGGIMLYLAYKKGRNKSCPDTKSEDHLNRESRECMIKPENSCASASTTPL